jgi:hypothetical protein
MASITRALGVSVKYVEAIEYDIKLIKSKFSSMNSDDKARALLTIRTLETVGRDYTDRGWQ